MYLLFSTFVSGLKLALVNTDLGTYHDRSIVSLSTNVEVLQSNSHS